MRKSHKCAIPECSKQTYGEICSPCKRVIRYWSDKPTAARLQRVGQLDKWYSRMGKVMPAGVHLLRRKHHA